MGLLRDDVLQHHSQHGQRVVTAVINVTVIMLMANAM